MDLQIIFQWHKVLHIILPIIIIPILKKRVGLLRACSIVFMVGLLKEVHDIVIVMDPLWESAVDMIFDLIGILLGIIATK
ncbi:hypothetical protein ACJDU8_23120 [Clostridium sp. WILCCON 0269]|uniref:VanZ-like domain-containing protein n=1 Tax=Candidatus Clostridium eludens TaxID=3381663 RepID=A0ABW8SRJ3_9CLOT